MKLTETDRLLSKSEAEASRLDKLGSAKRTELLSRIDAAAYLGIKPQTLAVWSCNRRYGIPMVKIGRLAKYRLADLDAFIAARTIGGNAGSAADSG